MIFTFVLLGVKYMPFFYPLENYLINCTFFRYIKNVALKNKEKIESSLQYKQTLKYDILVLLIIMLMMVFWYLGFYLASL